MVFGVFNEPFPVNYNSDGDTAAGWACDLNGCTVNDCTDSTGNCSGTYAGEGMRQMISDIRSVDSTTPLLAGGPDFAGDLDQWLATFYPGGVSIDPDNLLAASVHIYFPGGNWPCDLSTDVATSCPTTSQGAMSDNGIEQVAAVTPVLIDEVGDFGCSADSLTPFLSSVDGADASGAYDIGYVGWAWTTYSCDPNMITSWTTGQPSAMGTAEYCELYLDGLNDGALAPCAGTPVSVTTTTGLPPESSTTTTTTPPESTTLPTFPETFEGQVCQTVDYRYFETAEHGNRVSTLAAVRVEALLRNTTGPMFSEAQLLQDAITANSEAYIIGIFLYLQEVACPPVAIEPPS